MHEQGNKIRTEDVIRQRLHSENINLRQYGFIPLETTTKILKFDKQIVLNQKIPFAPTKFHASKTRLLNQI